MKPRGSPPPKSGRYNGGAALSRGTRLLLGGLDKRTALVVYPGGEAEVVGSGNVLVARRSPAMQAIPPRPGKALEARGLRFDVLAHGSRTALAELRRPCG